MKKIITNNEKETLAVAKDLAGKIKTAKIFALSGDLGAGKTVFSRGFIRGFGYKGLVSSPTFVLMKIYKIKNHPKIKNICHIDAYRLKTTNDLEAIGALDYFTRKDTVTLIEWPERVEKILPKNIKSIEIKYKEENQREIWIK